jgi:nicotinate-nucleotide adenylyltransferase
MARVGILGGSFNPPHVGHLVCAQEARDQLGLERVLLMPVGESPHKQLRADPGPRARLDMCRLATGGDPGLGVCAIELEREGPSYTVDTLRLLHEREPGDELTFIVGGDMADTLPTWREPREVLRLARMAVTVRDELTQAGLEDRLAELHDGSRVVFFAMPRLDVSSTELRRRVAEGRPIRHLVPDAVVDEIAAHGWYRETSTVGGTPAAQEQG